MARHVARSDGDRDCGVGRSGAHTCVQRCLGGAVGGTGEGRWAQDLTAEKLGRRAESGFGIYDRGSGARPHRRADTWCRVGGAEGPPDLHVGRR